VAVRGLHHCYLRPDALEPHHAVHPTALDGPLALQPDSKLDEERRRGREVVDTMPRCSMRWIVMRFSDVKPRPAWVLRSWLMLGS
jgi:hypothetical protein